MRPLVMAVAIFVMGCMSTEQMAALATVPPGPPGVAYHLDGGLSFVEAHSGARAPLECTSAAAWNRMVEELRKRGCAE